jgi:ribose transport system substrate-binding protein
VGIDTDDVVMQAIEDGVMYGTIVQNPYGHGYLSLLLLKYLSEGYVPRPDAYFVDAGFAFATQDNLETYNQDILKVTEQIKNDLLDKYLMKEGEAVVIEEPAPAFEVPADFKPVWYAPAPHPYLKP